MFHDNEINEEIIMENNMEYGELVSYLLEKYGHVKYDYFVNESCRSMSKKISRTKEGLLCHHIDEDKGENLSTPSCARLHPFKYQKAERLVYCNYLEHLMLHIKIGKMLFWKTYKKFDTPWLADNFIPPGMVFICWDINGFFENDGDSIEWRNNCYLPIKNFFNEYIYILNRFFFYIRENYKERAFEIGEQIKTRPFSIFSDVKILACKEKKLLVQQKIGGRIVVIDIGEKGLNTVIDRNKRELASNYKKQLFKKVYESLI